jgi:hypothetical protein
MRWRDYEKEFPEGANMMSSLGFFKSGGGALSWAVIRNLDARHN